MALREAAEISIDNGVQQLIGKARQESVETAFDRAQQMTPVCSFGSSGVCCRLCLEGPCRILPNGREPQRGVCGAGVDTIVARNFLAALVSGTAPHAEHGREVALALLATAEGKTPFAIKDVDKLLVIAGELGIATENRETSEIAREVALKALEDFQKQQGAMNWVDIRAQGKTRETWDKLGLTPVNAHLEISRAVTRGAMGCDADPLNLLLGAITMGLVDGFAGLHLSSDLQDILFGTPRAVKSKYCMGVLQSQMVNIAVHGHVPMLSEKIVEWAGKLNREAKKMGAEGINVVGVCCTGNELLMRQGVPVASSFSSQELVIVTGAVEAMVVDIQCIMPGIQKVAECYHTKIITTMGDVKIPGATHVEFHPETADHAAEQIVRLAVENFSRRDASRVAIPEETVEAYAGFSVEQIIEVLAKLDGEQPLKPLADAIASGAVRGVAALVGCTNPREKQDFGNVTVAKELLRNNVLVVTTGCAAHSLGKHGLMNISGLDYCGAELRNVLITLGKAAGLPALPPALHMGSCVDNSRPANLLKAVADYLGVAIRQLPVVGSCPETHSPKAMSIGTYFIACGVDVHVGVNPQIGGSEFVTAVLCNGRSAGGITTDEVFGGKLIYQPDPLQAAQALLDRIDQKRAELGLPVPEREVSQHAG